MTVALICSQDALEGELGGTLLWWRGIERLLAARLEEARAMAAAARPAVVLVDKELPRSARLITQLREDPATRGLSIAVLARGDFELAEVELLEAGANAILRIPPGPEWDERLLALLHVPIRREIRIPIRFAVEAAAGLREIPALALNLSANGMLVECHPALAVGDELGVSFSLPGNAAMVACRTRVVRQAGADQYGMAFLALDGGGRQRIEAFVATVKAS
jgi:DNA-binding response OmpR family regulator